MKDLLRKKWLEVRQSLSPQRRELGEQQLLIKLTPFLEKSRLVLSYASFQSELSTQILNNKLIENQKLTLPKIVGEELWIYSICSIDEQLEISPFGIPEPTPAKCTLITPDKIDLVVVPAIAFDCNNHRLGYGKGYFDRFLEKHQQHFKTIGIGFNECFSNSPFPSKPHDIALDQILLV